MNAISCDCFTGAALNLDCFDFRLFLSMFPIKINDIVKNIRLKDIVKNCEQYVTECRGIFVGDLSM